jgi:uncharacterized protein
VPTFLWKRLDQAGHDACRFTRIRDGWTIEGAAVFDHVGRAANLAYRLVCDSQWRSLGSSVNGWIGDRNIQIDITRSNDSWCINGVQNDALSGLNDIDLGFTPASNTIAIRRLNLLEGDEAKSVAVWLDKEDWFIKPLHQTYRRIQKYEFSYVSPQHDYSATLMVDGFGAVIHYPELWVMLNQSKL